MKSGLRMLRAQGAPVSYTASGRMPAFTMLTGGRTPEAYLRAYGKMGTLWSTVSLLASSTARPEWRLYRKTTDNRVRYSTVSEGSDQRTEVLQHPALAVLNHPSAFWTRFELMEQYQQFLDLTGSAHMLLSYDDRATFPVEMWPVRPDRIDPVPSQENFLAGWVYRSPDGEQVPLKLNEIIQVRYPDPMDPYGGCGPVQSVLTDIDAGSYAAEYNRNFFYSGADPGGVITVPNKLTDEEWDEFADRWRETHQGVARAHHIAVLEGGMTWAGPGSTSQKDMEFTGLRNMSRDIVREAYGMHKVMLGVTEDVNRANAQTGEEVFYSWKVIPRLDRWKMIFNERFLPLFGAGNVEFDYIAPKPQNREQDNEELSAKAGAAQLLVAAGFDPHAVLEVVGLPDMPFGAPAPAPVAAIPAPQDPDSGDGESTESGDEITNRMREILASSLPRLNGYHLEGVK